MKRERKERRGNCYGLDKEMSLWGLIMFYICITWIVRCFIFI